MNRSLQEVEEAAAQYQSSHTNANLGGTPGSRSQPAFGICRSDSIPIHQGMLAFQSQARKGGMGCLQQHLGNGLHRMLFLKLLNGGNVNIYSETKYLTAEGPQAGAQSSLSKEKAKMTRGAHEVEPSRNTSLLLAVPGGFTFVSLHLSGLLPTDSTLLAKESTKPPRCTYN